MGFMDYQLFMIVNVKLKVTNELNVGRHTHQLLFLFFQFLFLDFFLIFVQQCNIRSIEFCIRMNLLNRSQPGNAIKEYLL